MSYLAHRPYFALAFGLVGCGMTFNAAVRIFSWISFDPQAAPLTIRKWPRQPVTIQPQDCLKLDSRKFVKLTYRSSGHTPTYTIICSYEDGKAWTAYAHKWLPPINTLRMKQADDQVAAIEGSADEDDYNKRLKT